MTTSFSRKLFCWVFLIFGLLIIGSRILAANTQLRIEIAAPSTCGNGVRQGSEQCDGSDLGVETCVSQGFSAGGVLACSINCTFDTSNCSSGGGGGGGWIPPPTVETKVIFQGKAYPGAKITFLKDAYAFATITADSTADFEKESSILTPGVYTFGVWAEDTKGRKSITFSFTTKVISGVTTTISGIFLPPTIELEKTNLQRGETLDIFGQTAPQSDVSIHVESNSDIIKETEAGISGDWLYTFDTAVLENGSHTTRAKAVSPEGLLSSFSKVLGFHIGERAPSTACPGADLNKDDKVNLIDFSILLYWWGKADICADQNVDGIVNLIDFSIMMYYWTG